ncbi:hypothetical protein F5146DRAFT_1224225 [Armillaria mellea]|nr:hypothetical protein F5146DRAFT_1224225 [Armillaria mellea]
METSVRLIFKEGLQALQTTTRQGVFNVLWRMRNRVSTKPPDKVAGLAYVLSAMSIPIYDETPSEEDAWAAFVNFMPKLYLQELLLYPEPGDVCKVWRQSWNQVMAGTLPSSGGITRTYEVVQTGELEGDCGGIPRQGELVIEDFTGAPHTIKISGNHAYPIPNGDGKFAKFASVVKYFIVDLIRFVISANPMVEIGWRTALGRLLDVEKVPIASTDPTNNIGLIRQRLFGMKM